MYKKIPEGDEPTLQFGFLIRPSLRDRLVKLFDAPTLRWSNPIFRTKRALANEAMARGLASLEQEFTARKETRRARSR